MEFELCCLLSQESLMHVFGYSHNVNIYWSLFSLMNVEFLCSALKSNFDDQSVSADWILLFILFSCGPISFIMGGTEHQHIHLVETLGSDIKYTWFALNGLKQSFHTFDGRKNKPFKHNELLQHVAQITEVTSIRSLYSYWHSVIILLHMPEIKNHYCGWSADGQAAPGAEKTTMWANFRHTLQHKAKRHGKLIAGPGETRQRLTLVTSFVIHWDRFAKLADVWWSQRLGLIRQTK